MKCQESIKTSFVNTSKNHLKIKNNSTSELEQFSNIPRIIIHPHPTPTSTHQQTEAAKLPYPQRWDIIETFLIILILSIIML